MDVHLGQSDVESSLASNALLESARVEPLAVFALLPDLGNAELYLANPGLDGLGFEAVGVTNPGVSALIWRGSQVVGLLELRDVFGFRALSRSISDRYVAYLFISLNQRRVCLAHLSRDFLRMAEGEPDLQWLGARLSNMLGEVFRLWHLFKGGGIERLELQRWTAQLRTRMFALLDEGAQESGYETPGMCRGIIKTEPAMWTYLYHVGVEPTNNVGEQKARIGVMCRKVSQGTRSNRGSRFVERVLTTSATLRQQGRNVSQHIVDVAHTVLNGAPEPDLIK